MSGYLAAAAVVTAIGIGVSSYESNKSRQEARAANRQAQRIENVKAQRERVQALRQNRLSVATQEALAGNAGVADSSPVQGAIASSQTQTAANIGFANEIDSLNAIRMQHIDAAQGAQSDAGLATAIAGLASSGISGYGDLKYRQSLASRPATGGP